MKKKFQSYKKLWLQRTKLSTWILPGSQKRNFLFFLNSYSEPSFFSTFFLDKLKRKKKLSRLCWLNIFQFQPTCSIISTNICISYSTELEATNFVETKCNKNSSSNKSQDSIWRHWEPRMMNNEWELSVFKQHSNVKRDVLPNVSRKLVETLRHKERQGNFTRILSDFDWVHLVNVIGLQENMLHPFICESFRNFHSIMNNTGKIGCSRVFQL